MMAREQIPACDGVVVRVNGKGFAEPLRACTDWDKATHRHPNPIREWRWKHDIACNVFFTGSTPRLAGGAWWRRGLVVWVGDGEPDQTSPADIRCEADGRVFIVDRVI